jgi:hypothetical protein
MQQCPAVNIMLSVINEPEHVPKSWMAGEKKKLLPMLLHGAL